MAAPLVAGAGGILVGLIKIWMGNKTAAKENAEQRTHDQLLAANGQLLETQKLRAQINIRELRYVKSTKWKFGKFEFSFDKDVVKEAAILSPAQWWTNLFILIMLCTYCWILSLWAYNPGHVVYAFGPDNATSDWSLFLGLASRTVSDPQVVAITLGGLAFWLLQPLISLVTATITGLAYKLIK